MSKYSQLLMALAYQIELIRQEGYEDDDLSEESLLLVKRLTADIRKLRNERPPNNRCGTYVLDLK